jgi:hypothetical protein
MRFQYVRSMGRLALYGFLAVVMTACFKNAGQDSLPVMSTSLPIDPVYKAATDSYLWAHGSCGTLTSILFTYSSSLTSQNTVEGICKNGQVSANLPVMQGDQPQTFTVKLVAKLKNKMSPPLTMTVNYTPTPPLSPGYALLPGGGQQTFTLPSGNYAIQSSIGEWYSPHSLTGTGMTFRTGVEGITNP